MAEAITISNDIKDNKYFSYDDIQAIIKRGGKGIPLNKEYDPKVFWDSMGSKFYRAFDKPEKCAFAVDFFVDRMKGLQPIENTLEVGCGFARLAPFLLQRNVTKSYQGIDISEKLLSDAQSYLDPSIIEESEHKKLDEILSNGHFRESTKKILSDKIKPVFETLKSQAEEKARKRSYDFRENIKLGIGDVRSLDFPDNSFDCVISSECLQHLNPEDVQDAVSHIICVSKKYIILLERWSFPGEHSEPHIWSHNLSDLFKDQDILQITTISQGLQGAVIRKR